MTKRAIPQIPRTQAEPRQNFDLALKEVIEVITGRRGNKIQPLATNASQADLIAKVNEIINLLQD